jgi:hypothetical protein
MRLVLAMVTAAACATPAPDPGAPVTDVRVPVPAPDPRFVDLVSPELVIEPGTEAIYCYHADNVAGRFGTARVLALQGTGGHHIALRRADAATRSRRPDGTFEDCTHDQSERQLGDVLVGELPPGWAAEIEADAQLVLEMHYANATDLPLRVRDVIRIERMPDAEVVRWLQSMHLRIYDLVVLPGESALAFDCTAPSDLALYHYWGHQHGAGTAMDVAIERPGAAALALYDVVWGVGPAVRGDTSAPIAIPEGTRFRITCRWRNEASHPIAFPDEMCAFGGIVEGAAFSCAPASHRP